MVLGGAAVVLCLAGASLEVASEGPAPTRMRASLGGTFGGIGGGFTAGGAGVSFELGSSLTSRISLVGRLNVGTLIVFAALQGGFAVGVWLNEHFELSLGGAVAFSGGLREGLVGEFSVLAPLRVMVTPLARSGAQRGGLMLFLEAAPGASFLRMQNNLVSSSTGFVLAAWLGVGYAWG